MSVDEDEMSERGTLEGESSGKSHVSGVADEDGLSSPGSANDQVCPVIP